MRDLISGFYILLITGVLLLMGGCVNVDNGENDFRVSARGNPGNDDRLKPVDEEEHDPIIKRRGEEEEIKAEWFKEAEKMAENWVSSIRQQKTDRAEKIMEQLKETVTPHRKEIVRLLHEGTEYQKTQVLKIAGFVSDEQVADQIRYACEAEKAGTRNNAYISLGVYGPTPSDKELLMKGLKDDSAEVRSSAGFALSIFGKQHPDKLSENDLWPYLMDTYPWARNEIVRTLGWVGTRKSLTFLEDRLTVEQSNVVQINMVAAMYRISRGDHLKVFVRMLKNRNPNVQQMARAILQKETGRDFGRNTDRWMGYLSDEQESK